MTGPGNGFKFLRAIYFMFLRAIYFMCYVHYVTLVFTVGTFVTGAVTIFFDWALDNRWP